MCAQQPITKQHTQPPRSASRAPAQLAKAQLGKNSSGFLLHFRDSLRDYAVPLTCMGPHRGTAPFALDPCSEVCARTDVCASHGRGGCEGTNRVRSDKHTAWASLAPVGALAQKHRLADLLPRQVGHPYTRAQPRAAMRSAEHLQVCGCSGCSGCRRWRCSSRTRQHKMPTTRRSRSGGT